MFGRSSKGGDKSTSSRTPIRKKLSSVRLYLTGQAQLRGSSSSSWRSSKEIAKLKSLYGEHACLTFASLEERRKYAQRESVIRAPDATGGEDQGGKTLIEQADKIALHLRLHSHKSTFRSDLRVLKENMPQGDEDVICFWMTNVLELLDVKEQIIEGCEVSWNEETTQPKGGETNNLPKARGNRYQIPRRPLKLPDYDVIHRVLHATRGDDHSDEEEYSQESSTDDSDSDSAAEESRSSLTEGDQVQSTAAAPDAWEQIMASADLNPINSSIRHQRQDLHLPLKQSQIALTFRSSLPEDVPPTMSAECIKYFYSVVLVVTTEDGELLVTDCPFHVLTRNSPNSLNPRPSHLSHPASSTRVHIGELHAMAHSSSLPFRLSPIEALGAKQLHVVSDPPACSIVSRISAERRTSTHRIQNENGALCGWMTLVGVGGPMGPGTRLGIIVQFPRVQFDEIDGVGEAGIIPCYRVCCALVGEEYALCEGVTAPVPSSGAQPKKRKTRSYVFDSSYELVEFGYTNSLSMGLLLPSDCPVTIKTDLVVVVVSLKFEFTVDRVAIRKRGDKVDDECLSYMDSSDGGSGFGVIRLELPIEVVHNDEVANEEEEEGSFAVQNHLAAIRRFWKNDSATTSNAYFDDSDIHDDLKMLSLRLLA
ncbi:hypothetical protein HJC23_013456 [Cyclotella cryptica]|uniref:Uncharacterized protein n=1 Tax=Cyclotella cryptica TaxID=29204 RepID=A0ABD3NEV5_9STRA|eukprot:CCRYP_021135-RB/>CCRYP_021135-RB protein AED:0.11 eAED:0.11 QI:488/1/1/1/0.5/0.2/5/2776/649